MTETFFSGEDEESKENDQVLCTTILYSFYVCEINVESIKNRTTLNEVSEIIQPRDLSYDFQKKFSRLSMNCS